VASLAAMAVFFVLIQRIKNQVNPKASLLHRAFALQNAQNQGWELLPFASPLTPWRQ